VIIVSDTSPIISLAAIGELDLLAKLYHKVHIPQAVCQEIVSGGSGKPGGTNVLNLSWISVVPVANEPLVATLNQNLGSGEAEAIALALQLNADTLLMDERRGRSAAAALGVKVIGLLGFVLELKHSGIVPAVKPLLDALVARGGMWLSQRLYKQTLQTAGE
jgi:uncharacterized protein